MDIKVINKKTIALLDHNEETARLVYPSSFKLDANILLPNNDEYKIIPSGFFSSKMNIVHRGEVVGSITSTMKGNIELAFNDDFKYTLKLTKWFKSEYALYDENKENIISVIPKFSWNNFSYNYALKLKSTKVCPLLVLACLYSVNYMIQLMSAIY